MQGIDGIVFNRIARSLNFCSFQSLDGSHQFDLGFQRQTGGNPVGIIFIGVEPFRFQKNLVAVLIFESYNFVFDTRTITWPRPFNDTLVQGRLVQIVQNDFVRKRVGVGDETADLRESILCWRKRKQGQGVIPLLFFEPAEINGLAINPGNGACLEAQELQTTINT
ncbi:MAG: hypothetical protein ACD_62C00231G0002 [uncultured bacterium]|nr:MAG: hypothetical protein ACD_62C00231G0002 [uncultured bacterium]